MARSAVVVCAVALALASCHSAPEPAQAAETTTIGLDAAGPRTTAAVEFGHQVKIQLPPAIPGHAWQIAAHDWRFLKQVSEPAPSNAGDGAWSVSFLTQRTGTTRLRFVLAPATAGREAELADSREIVLTIQ